MTCPDPSLARKPVSKRVRFEVFKRDDFTCQYCGAHPPAVVLEVDHIIAVANGGTNDEENLITACFDCNRGKSAIPLSMIPTSLADRAVEIAERESQLAGYNAVLAAQRERIDDQIWEIFEYWTGERETTHERYEAVKRFLKLLPIGEILDAVDATKAGAPLNPKRQFLYFCKVCWNKVNPQNAR